MGKTLSRYVLSEVVGLLAFGLVLTTSILASVKMVDLVDLVFARGVPARQVGVLFAYMLPSYLELTLPMALLLSTIAAFARLARDNELLAMRAAGLSLWTVARPLLPLAMVVATSSFALAAQVGPWANRTLSVRGSRISWSGSERSIARADMSKKS